MNFWLILGLAFFAGTYLLWRSRVERHFIVFIIRTRHFLRIIDAIAFAAPSLWKFLADCAIVFSFSGVGIAYLSRYRKLSGSLNLIFIILGILAIVGINQNPVNSVAILMAIIIITAYLNRKPSQKLDFLFGSILISIIFLRIPTLALSLMGYSWQLPLWLALLGGFFGIIPLLIGAFILNAYNILFLGSNQAGIAPAIPGERDGELVLEFYGTDMVVPLVYAIIAIVITVVSHELAHGILARVYKLRLKSTGIVTAGALPIGAFVEPDEREIDKRPSIEKMHVFAAGSFANFLVSVLSALLFLFVSISMIYSPFGSEGIAVVSVMGGYPADGILEQGMIIREIDGESVSNGNLFVEKMNRVAPGDEIAIKTNRGEFLLRAEENPERQGKAFIGVSWVPYNPVMSFILLSLFWIFFINLNISLVNVLPMAPFDGWRMLNEVMLTFDISDTAARRFVTGVLTLMILLLLVNVLPLFSDVFNSALGLLV